MHQTAALLLTRPTAREQDTVEAQLGEVRLEETPPRNNHIATTDTTTSSSTTSSSSPASPSSSHTQQRDQTRLTLQEMHEEQEEAAASEPQAVSLRQIKREIADCLIYTPRHLASFLEDDIKAVQALVLILHRHLITAREDKKKSTTTAKHMIKASAAQQTALVLTDDGCVLMFVLHIVRKVC